MLQKNYTGVIFIQALSIENKSINLTLDGKNRTQDCIRINRVNVD